MTNQEQSCGGEPCNKIVDRLGTMMGIQQAAGFKSIEKLMTVHHQTLKDEITDLKAANKAQSDEIFPRLRDVEERVSVIEAVDITESQVKDIIAENENIVWVSRARSRTAKVMIVVVAGLILTTIGFLPKIIIFIRGLL